MRATSHRRRTWDSATERRTWPEISGAPATVQRRCGCRLPPVCVGAVVAAAAAVVVVAAVEDVVVVVVGVMGAEATMERPQDPTFPYDHARCGRRAAADSVPTATSAMLVEAGSRRAPTAAMATPGMLVVVVAAVGVAAAAVDMQPEVGVEVVEEGAVAAITTSVRSSTLQAVMRWKRWSDVPSREDVELVSPLEVNICRFGDVYMMCCKANDGHIRKPNCAF